MDCLPWTVFYIVLSNSLTMITLIGAAHVFDISERIREEIIDHRPNVVAVELDKARYHALKSGERGSGNLPLIYRLLQKVQKRLAEKFDVQVGEEMIVATDTAQEINAGVAFIDIPAQKIMSRLMNEMSFKEKIYLIAGGIIGLFTTKEKVKKEMERYHSNEDKNMVNIAEKMPVLSKILIKERNQYMSQNLKKLEDKYGSVVAVVGDGHVPGMKRELSDRELEVIRLKEVMSPKEEKKDEGNDRTNETNQSNQTNAEVSYSFEQGSEV